MQRGFLLAVDDGSGDVVVDGGEIDLHRWYRPLDAIDESKNKKIKMMPPTFVTLTQLSQCSSAQAAINMFSQREVMEFKPKFTMNDERVCMLYSGDIGYDTGDSTLEGEPRHRLWMLDSGWVYEKT